MCGEDGDDDAGGGVSVGDFRSDARPSLPEPRRHCSLRYEVDHLQALVRGLRRALMQGQEPTYIRWEGRLPPPYRGVVPDPWAYAVHGPRS